jgi:hypothetical protein
MSSVCFRQRNAAVSAGSERLAHRSIAEFTGAKPLATTARPALLLHARDDAEVPFSNAEEIVARGLPAELVGQSSSDLAHPSRSQ